MKPKAVMAALLAAPAMAAPGADQLPVSVRCDARYDPGHPLADAVGMVLVAEDGALPAPPLEAGGGNPPDMPGWPRTYPYERPLEGPVLVETGDDPSPEILFSTGKVVHLVNLEGDPLPGWPITIGVGRRLAGGPAFGDVDGDGDGEVVVCPDMWPNGSRGWVYAYETDGTVVPGYPVLTNGDYSRSPTVSDLDGDGAAEIIVGERDWPIGSVYVIGGGQVLEGWPRPMDHVPASSAGAADLDGDGVKEIVFESFLSLYAWHLDGTAVSGFPFTMTQQETNSYSAPVFADVDDDGLPEIAFGTHSTTGPNRVFLIDGDGSVMPGWPRNVTYWVYAPPTFADLDGDDDLEIIVGDQVLSGSPADRVYAWHVDGSTVPGFPIGPIWAINAQVVVGDVDGDGDPELIWDDNTGTGRVMGYHHTGQPIDGWPLSTSGSTFFNTVALTDGDDDGDLELLAASGSASDTTMYLWDLPAQADPADIQMPMFQYGPGRCGEPAACEADLDGSGEVGFGDLLALLTAWGPCEGCPEDLDGDDAVGFADLLILLAAWGPCS